jgi:outer membrane protein TolC
MKFLSASALRFDVATTLRAGLLAGLAALLAGCRTFSPDGGMSPVVGFIGQTLNKDVVAVRSPADDLWARGTVESLLKRPLTADTAVQVALLNNRGLQAEYNELGISEAALIANSRPPVPTFSISNVSTPLELDIERQIVVAILGLITQPARTKIASDRFTQAQLTAALATLRVAAEARRAYYRAVAARETVSALTQFKSAAEASAKLAKQLGETGALNDLDQARQQVFYADVTAQLATAQQQAMVEREQLVRVLGLWGYNLDFRLPTSLPRLPAKPRVLNTIEQEAMDRRVDLQIALFEVEALAKSYGLTRKTRFINVLDASGISKTQKDKGNGPSVDGGGFSVEFQVPIFDFGRPRLRQAEQRYMQAVNLLAEQAVNARSEAREAYRSYRATYDIARHFQSEVLPLRQIIFDQSKLQANAMLIDVFSLLTEARERIAANVNSIEAERNFWLAETELRASVLGGGALSPDAGTMIAADAGGAAGH